MARKPVVRLTANFERNLAEIEQFLTGAEAPQAYDALLDELLEYVLGHYLVLYAQVGGNLHLLAIRHHRQLSFDFQSHWGGTSPTR